MMSSVATTTKLYSRVPTYLSMLFTLLLPVQYTHKNPWPFSDLSNGSSSYIGVDQDNAAQSYGLSCSLLGWKPVIKSRGVSNIRALAVDRVLQLWGRLKTCLFNVSDAHLRIRHRESEREKRKHSLFRVVHDAMDSIMFTMQFLRELKVDQIHVENTSISSTCSSSTAWVLQLRCSAP